MDTKIIDYARLLHVMAVDDILLPEKALEFVRDYLGHFIAEIELAARLTEAKADALFAQHVEKRLEESPPPVPAVAKKVVKKKPVKKAAKKVAKKKAKRRAKRCRK